MIRIEAGPYKLDVDPDLGGSIAALAWGGRPLLRPTPPGARHAMSAASFVMAPFANRIANGRFSFGGHDVALAATSPGEVHPLHGLAWLSPWRIEEAAPARVRLSQAYPGGAWPWPFATAQTISVSDQGALFELTLTNTGPAAMPASIGMHPAFPRTPETALQTRVEGYWRSSNAVLPTDYIEGADLAGLEAGVLLAEAPFTDQCYAGWSGALTIKTPPLAISLTAAPTLDCLHLYIPVGGDYFCAEPVSAMPDAFNRREQKRSGLRVLESGETLSAWMRIAAAETP